MVERITEAKFSQVNQDLQQHRDESRRQFKKLLRVLRRVRYLPLSAPHVARLLLWYPHVPWPSVLSIFACVYVACLCHAALVREHNPSLSFPTHFVFLGWLDPCVQALRVFSCFPWHTVSPVQRDQCNRGRGGKHITSWLSASP